MIRTVTVADCERVQAAWFERRVAVLGGEVYESGSLRWLAGPDGVSLMFPPALPPADVARGVAWARPRGVIVGAWLGAGVDAGPLAAAGFESGWEPWWMTARLDAVGEPDDDRIQLRETTEDYGGEHAGYADSLALARQRPKDTWYAAAHTRRSHRFAGHAWSHLVPDDDGALAGIFDMEVWPRLQRRGFGTGLLRAVCAGAAAAGATDAVLNATPAGKKLYETCGFRQIGAGITWWLHPG